MPVPALPHLRTNSAGAVIIDIHVVPNAKVTQLDGLHDAALRIRLHAPPVDGKANEALLIWLARQLAVPRRHLTLLRGLAARRKQVQVDCAVVSQASWGNLTPQEQRQG